MPPPFSRESSLSVLVAVVAIMVLALGGLQYRWLGQVSEAERDRMQRSIRTAAAQFRIGFDQEVSRAAQTLQVDAASIRDDEWAAYAERYDRWANQATDIRLVHDLLVVDELPRGSRQLRIRRWNRATHTVESAAWPTELADLRDGIAASLGPVPLRPGADLRRRREPVALPHTDTYTLLRPSTEFLVPDRPGTAPRLSVIGVTIIRLDPAFIATSLLPGLAAQHFHLGVDGADYRVAIVEAEPPHHVIWESAPGLAAAISRSPDVSQPLLGLRPTLVVASTGTGPSGEDRGPGAPGASPRTFLELIPGPPPTDGDAPSLRPDAGPGAESRWLLLATHQAGSLTAAVSAVRRRNLLLSSGILLLLTTAVGLIAVSARRAQTLARQQIEFVAAVSHELRTPVSVIDTAARNLADGFVSDPARVRRYGSTISTEARRLTDTVERVLQLSGIAAGSAAVPHAAVSVEQLVRDSLAACQPELDARAVRVEVSLPDALPDVHGDAPALRSALQNLISNAIKYGGDARWLGISARAASGPQQPPMVSLTVSDRGLGIAPEDRARVLEPFYRGRLAMRLQIPGSGLGLHLVSRIVAAHHGRISIVSEPDAGTQVTLTLPVASDHQGAASPTTGVHASAAVVVSPQGLQ